MRGLFVALGLTVVVAASACGAGDDEESNLPSSTTEPAAEPSTTSEATTTTSEPTTSSIEGDWSLVADDNPWGARAGLRIVELGESLFLMGGRTPNQSSTPGDSVIWGDVWRSDDDGATWEEVSPTDQAPIWPARAYFQAVVKGDEIFVLGGQDFALAPNPFCALLEQGIEPPPGLGIDPDAPCPEFVPTSNFFNDVWASADGVVWEERTADAPWAGRAGLSAAVLGDDLLVFAGSQNDDSAVVGAGGPSRVYFNDVWRSSDGVEWELLTDAAPWAPRAGASVVERDGEVWMFGGEDGFTCDPLPDCDPPYFNDVWRTADGVTWTEVSTSAAWSPRPGHQCELLTGQFVCFGGFGLVENPDDVWASADGIEWDLLDGSPWNAADPEDVRYDFDSTTITTADGPVIVTAGGDRETFDFDDPENYLRVEDDIWYFTPR